MFLRKLPGFRGGSRIKMFLSTIIHIFLIVILLSSFKGVTFKDKIIEELRTILLIGIPYLILGNFKNIQQKLPFLRSNNSDMLRGKKRSFKKLWFGTIVYLFLYILLLGSFVDFTEQFFSLEQKILIEYNKQQEQARIDERVETQKKSEEEEKLKAQQAKEKMDELKIKENELKVAEETKKKEEEDKIKKAKEEEKLKKRQAEVEEKAKQQAEKMVAENEKLQAKLDEEQAKADVESRKKAELAYFSSPEYYKSQCVYIDYPNLIRVPKDHIGKKLVNTGSVISVSEDNKMIICIVDIGEIQTF
jgi:flagellar biosynthesis GTPase FlhF